MSVAHCWYSKSDVLIRTLWHFWQICIEECSRMRTQTHTLHRKKIMLYVILITHTQYARDWECVAYTTPNFTSKIVCVRVCTNLSWYKIYFEWSTFSTCCYCCCVLFLRITNREIIQTSLFVSQACFFLRLFSRIVSFDSVFYTYL